MARSTGWRGWLGCLTAVGVLLAIAVAWAFLRPMGYWPGSSMTTAWVARSTADEATPKDATDRTWVAGDTVVRGGPGGVRAFHAGSGAKHWEDTPPRLTDMCALSPTADDAVVLIAYGERGGRCATTAALDLRDGRELWHAARGPALDTQADRDLDRVREGGVGGAGYTHGGLHTVAGRVMAMRTSTTSGDILHTFDAATGDEEERVFRDLVAPAQELVPYRDLLIAVHPGDGKRPLSAYERW